MKTAHREDAPLEAERCEAHFVTELSEKRPS